MPYQGSYIWKLRQKIGHDLLIVPSADTLAIDEKGKVLLVFNKDFNNWFLPGGYVEEGQSSVECAARELLEEGGLIAAPQSLVPFAFVSGHSHTYGNGDVTQPFTQFFFTETWTDASDTTDTEEIRERQWFTTDELQTMAITPYVVRILDAYQTYRHTGTYQIIDSATV